MEYNYDSIKTIILKWDKYFKSANKRIDKDFGNKQFLKNMEDFLVFIQDNYSVLSSWCAQYLLGVSFKEKVENWLRYGVEHIKDNTIYRKHWGLFFRNEGADIITLDGEEYDISYPNYVSLCAKRKSEYWFENCDDEDILNIHKDKECDHDFYCFLCDEQQDKWEKLLKTRYTAYKNIFMDTGLRTKFVDSWLKGAFKLDEVEQDKIHYIWPPIREYKYSFFYNKVNTISLDEFINQVSKMKWETYYGYHIRPKVEYEQIRDLQTSLSHYKLYDSIIIRKNKNENENKININQLFLFLSHILPYIQYILAIDIKRCNEMKDVYSKLPDD